MFDALGDAARIFFSGSMLATVVIGATVGIVTSVMPGVGGITVLALLMVFTLGMEQHQAMAFLVTLMASAGFAGSLTAILLNVPGDTQNAATLLDGYPLSQQGRAGEAIGASAAASALGALFGVVVLVSLLPFMRNIVLSFGPPEMFALSLAGIALIGVISRGNTVGGLIAGMAGMTIAFVGLSRALGGHRFTFGFPQLYDGVPLVPVVIGLFAIPEIYRLLVKNQPVSGDRPIVPGGVWKGIFETVRHPLGLLRGSALGTLVGMVPGIGGSVAPWVAYSVARATSRHPESFGKGNIQGVIAPEAANDAKDGGALMPLLALGIPGSLSTAFILSAFMFHGVLPGPRIFERHMSIVWVMIFALLFTNFFSSSMGLLFARQLILVTRVPILALAPVVLGFSMVGSFTDTRSLWALLILLAVGCVGVAMARADYPRAPFLVGFVLLPLVETNFHRSLQIHRGSYDFLLRPITLTVIVLTALIILAPFIARTVGAVRRRIWEEKPFPGPDPSLQATHEVGGGPDLDSQGKTIAALFLNGLVLIAGSILIVISMQLRADGRLFPLIVMIPMCLLAAAMLLRELRKIVIGKVPIPSIGTARESARVEVRVAGWVIVLPLLIVGIGILPGIALFTVLLTLFFEGRRAMTWTKLLLGIALAAGTVTIIYATFERLLGVTFPTGLVI